MSINAAAAVTSRDRERQLGSSNLVDVDGSDSSWAHNILSSSKSTVRWWRLVQGCSNPRWSSACLIQSHDRRRPRPAANKWADNTCPFNSSLSETTWVSRYKKDKTDLDFTEARDSEWQWHQLGHMQVYMQPTVSKHWRQPSKQIGEYLRATFNGQWDKRPMKEFPIKWQKK